MSDSLAGKKWADIEDDDGPIEPQPDPLVDVVAAEKIAAASVAETDVDLPPENPNLQAGTILVNETELAPVDLDKKFEDLVDKDKHDLLLRGLYSMQYNKPSKIQASSLPLILKKENLIGQAQSGTGKTGAFGLGILSSINLESKHPQAVCVCPTRELARQTYQVIIKMSQYLILEKGLKVLLAIQRMEKPPVIDHQIIIGTPGTIINLKVRNWKTVQMLVVDEADEMLNEDKREMAKQTLDIKKKCVKAQIICFSATYNDSVRAYLDKVVPQPRNKIELKREEVVLSQIKQFFIDLPNEAAKLAVFGELYNHLDVGQSIIFVQTRKTCKEVARKMRSEGYEVGELHGEMEHNERDVSLDSFRNKELNALVATNVLARGIDIPEVSLVVNYELPVMPPRNTPDFATYIHRIGRTGRWDKSGMAINLLHDDASRAVMARIEKEYSFKCNELQRSQIPKLGEMLRALSRNDTVHKPVGSGSGSSSESGSSSGESSSTP